MSPSPLTPSSLTRERNPAMESTLKREYPTTYEQQYEEQQQQSKRLKNPNSHHFNSVKLNPADCDLAFNIEADGLTGHALHENGFAYCWSGARGTVGINGGKYYFGCKVVAAQPVMMEDTPPDQQNVCRIGISRGDDPVGNLGETDHSYGYGGTGKFSNGGRFVDYGGSFGVGDMIICLVDLESKPCSVEFYKNGKQLGIAKRFDLFDSSNQKLPWKSALFPHVLLKNTVVEMQFSIEDGLIPIEGYKTWALAIKDEKAVVGPCLEDLSDCEVIMMVGLPASGKSTWAEKCVKEHPEKRYVLLGTNLALDQMKVPGLLRKNNYGERFDRLMDRATEIFNTLLARASKVPRNYIIDQTNVYKSARKRKLKPFAFYCKIAVVVFPRPEELKLRAEKRFKEMGKEVPPEAVNEMLANFVLPKSKDMLGADEYFDEVTFTDLNRSESQLQLDEMKFALASSTREKSRSDQPAYYSRESSVYSDSGLSSYSFPGSGIDHSRYTMPSAGVGGVVAGCSWVGRPEFVVPTYTANVNTGYSGYLQPTIDGVQPYQTNVNASYELSDSPYQRSLNSLPAKDAYSNTSPSEKLAPSGGYVRDPLSTQPYGPPVGFMSNPEGTRSAYQSSYGSYGEHNPSPQGQYGASSYGHPNPSPQGQYCASSYRHPNPSPQGQYGASSYGHLNPSPQGQYGAASSYRHPNPSPQEQYGASSFGHPNPSPQGLYDASSYGRTNPITHGNYPSNAQHPGLGGIAYGPPRYY